MDLLATVTTILPYAAFVYAIAASIWAVILWRKVASLEEEREYIFDVLEEIEESFDEE